MAIIEVRPAQRQVQSGRSVAQLPTTGIPGAIEAAGETAQGIARVADRVTQWATATQQAQDEARVNEVMLDYRGRLAEFRASRIDTDGTSSPSELRNNYNRGALALIEEVGANLGPTARARFTQQARTQLASDQMEIMAAGTRRLQQRGEAGLDGVLDTFAQDAVRNPAGRAVSIQQAEAAIAGAVTANLIPADRGERLRQQFVGRIAQAEVLRDINSNPTLALQRLASGQYSISDPVQAERLAAQARTQIQAQATLADVALRRQEHQQRIRANEAEKQWTDARARGDQAAMVRALGVLRRDGQPGQYAAAYDATYGIREPQTTPQMQSWAETRLRDRQRPLTREELEQARSSRQINDTVYRETLRTLTAREDTRFREAEQFVERALEVPSSTIPDSQLQPYQREARRQSNAIVNDLVLHRRDNPDADPLAFVRQRLEQANPQRALQQQRATAALNSAPQQVRTWEGFDQVAEQFAQWQAYRGLGWAARQVTGTVNQPVVRGATGDIRVTADMIQRWRDMLTAAGVQRQGAGR